jgi:hypothetical protein
MEEQLYKLNTIILIRKAISQQYSSIEDSEKLIECITLINDYEENVILELNNSYEQH